MAIAVGGVGAPAPTAQFMVHADEAGVPTPPATLAGAPDPTEWTVDADTGLQHRAATHAERDRYSWPVGTVFAEAAGPGPDGPRLAVPEPGGSVRVLAFQDPVALDPVTAVLHDLEQGVTESVTRTTRWTHHVDDAQVDLYTSEDGGLYARGLLPGHRFDVYGADAGRALDEVGDGGPDASEVLVFVFETVPEVSVPTTHCPIALLEPVCALLGLRPQCSDGIDNDGDGRTDYPADRGCTSSNDDSESPDPACGDGIDNDGDNWVDYPDDPGCTSFYDTSEFDSRTNYNFGLFGEIKFCNAVGGSWSTTLTAHGDDIEAGFDNNGGTRANTVHVFNHCWTGSNSCDSSGGCTDGSGHSYPYNGCNGGAQCYLDRVWNDVSHARLHSTFSSLKNAQTVHQGTMSYSGSTVCGIAYFPASGASVSIGSIAGTGCKQYVGTHEMGHNFQGDHPYAVSVGTCHTALKPSSQSTCRVDWFSDANRKRINDCMVNSWCPRSGTG